MASETAAQTAMTATAAGDGVEGVDGVDGAGGAGAAVTLPAAEVASAAAAFEAINRTAGSSTMSHTPTPLERIVARKRLEVEAARARVPESELRERIAELGRPRNFFRAVVDAPPQDRSRIIAEIKRRSPSAGEIRADFDPVGIARQYHQAGAAAISCLTDEVDFGGRLEFIHQIRDAVPVPVLRKDFIVDPYQVLEARAWGADAILLIAECLTEADIVDCQILATELAMTTLLEVHDVENLYRVINYVGFPHAGYSLLGINNRNLRTMTTDILHTIRLAGLLEEQGVIERGVVVSESGISTPEDLARLRRCGIKVALVGEHLLRQPDPGAALKALLAA